MFGNQQEKILFHLHVFDIFFRSKIVVEQLTGVICNFLLNLYLHSSSSSSSFWFLISTPTRCATSSLDHLCQHIIFAPNTNIIQSQRTENILFPGFNFFTPYGSFDLTQATYINFAISQSYDVIYE